MSFLSGLLGTVGSIFGGPIGGIISSVGPSVVSGLFADKANKQNMAAYGSRISTTVADARRAGIHPLEAIRAGAASSLPPQMASLVTPASLGNSFDQIADVLSGRTAQEQADREVQMDINRIKRDQMMMESKSLREQVGTGSGIKASAARQTPISTVAGTPSSWSPSGGFNAGAAEHHPLRIEGAKTTPAQNETEPLIKFATTPDNKSYPYVEDVGMGIQVGSQWAMDKITERDIPTEGDYRLIYDRLRNNEGLEGDELRKAFKQITGVSLND